MQKILEAMMRWFIQYSGERKLQEESFMQSDNPIAAALLKLYQLAQQAHNQDRDLFYEAKMLSILFKRFEDNSECMTHLRSLNPNRYTSDNLISLRQRLVTTGSLNEADISEILDKEINHAIEVSDNIDLPFELIDPETLPDGPFKTLIGKVKDVYILNDQKKIDDLVAAIDTPKWYQADIVKDPYLLFIALAGCKNGSISINEYITLSQFFEFRKKFGEENIEICDLLEVGQFTERSKVITEYLKINPAKNIFDKPFIETESQLENLRQLINELPYTDQIFFELKNVGDKDEIKVLGAGATSFRKIGLNYAVLTVGVNQAISEIAFPDHKFDIVPRFGMIKMKDIEEEMRQHRRIMSVYYQPYKTGYHSQNSKFMHLVFTELTSLIGAHDLIHKDVCISNSTDRIDLSFACVDVIRKYLKKTWSTGLWHLVDYDPNGLKSNQDILSNVLFSLEKAYRLTVYNDVFLPEIGVLLLDIAFNPDDWDKYNVNGTSVLERLRENSRFERYASFEEFIIDDTYFNKNDPVKFNLLKMNLLFNNSFPRFLQSSKEEVKRLFNQIDENKKEILKSIVIKQAKADVPNGHYFMLYYNNQLVGNKISDFQGKISTSTRLLLRNT